MTPLDTANRGPADTSLSGQLCLSVAFAHARYSKLIVDIHFIVTPFSTNIVLYERRFVKYIMPPFYRFFVNSALQ